MDCIIRHVNTFYTSIWAAKVNLIERKSTFMVLEETLQLWIILQREYIINWVRWLLSSAFEVLQIFWAITIGVFFLTHPRHTTRLLFCPTHFPFCNIALRIAIWHVTNPKSFFVLNLRFTRSMPQGGHLYWNSE